MSSPTESRETTAPATRGRTIAFAGLLLGGLLGLVAGSRPWWRADAGSTTVSFTGNEASGGLTWALAAVVLAGVLLAVALRALGRRVIAILLGLAGIGMIVTGLLRTSRTAEGVRTRLAQVSLVDTFALTPTAWPWVYAVAGLLACAGAAVMLVRAVHWPVRTARFDRAPAVAPVDLADDPTSAWQALDAGEDPTASHSLTDRDGESPPTPPPDVQADLPGDTMGVQGGSDTRREPS